MSSRIKSEWNSLNPSTADSLSRHLILKTKKVMQRGEICIIRKTKTQKYSRLNLWSTWFEYSL